MSLLFSDCSFREQECNVYQVFIPTDGGIVTVKGEFGTYSVPYASIPSFFKLIELWLGIERKDFWRCKEEVPEMRYYDMKWH